MNEEPNDVSLAVRETCEAYMFEVVLMAGGSQLNYPEALEKLPTDFLAALQENLQRGSLTLGWWLMVKKEDNDGDFFVTTQLLDDDD